MTDEPATQERDEGRAGTARRLLGDYAGAILAFGVVFYLALRGGGYDEVIRGPAGAVLWLGLLVTAAVGLFPARPFGRTTVALLALLGAFVAWTVLALVWTESAERTASEIARVAAYLGVFVLAIGIGGPNASRRILGGVAVAIGLVGALALLSRLHPSWFPANDLAESQPLARARLAYPLNAWNGLATLLSLGLPLLLAFAVHARHAVARALAAAALPVLMLAIYLTFSRGGLLALGLAIIAFVVLTPVRALAVAIAAVATAAGAALIFTVTRRDELADGLTSEVARDQGNEVLIFTVLAAVVVGLLAAFADRRLREWTGPRLKRSRATVAAGAAVVLVVVVGAIAAGAPGKLSDSWEDFKSPSIGQLEGNERFASLSGNGRYQYWGSALDAASDEPLTGIGPGTYEFWWSRNGDIAGFVRDAHSLYLEVFAEAGIVGLLLLLAFVVGVLIAGVRAAVRATGPQRGMLAGGVGAALAFSVALGFDWGWEIAAIPAAYLLVAGALVVGAEPGPGAAASTGWRPGRGFGRQRIAIAAVAVPAILVITAPFAGAMLIDDSEAAYGDGDLEHAMSRAQTAQDIEPYAATPYLQEALLREAQGDLHGAIPPIDAAIEREDTNWRLWLTLSRIRAGLNEPEPALAAWEEAEALNPRSVLVPEADPRATHPQIFEPQPEAPAEEQPAG